MPHFSKNSLDNLNTCTPGIQRVMHEVIREYDISILCGHRNEEDQNAAYKSGNSNAQWPNSSHNSNPSRAVDIAPYPIQWSDTMEFYRMAAFVLETAMRLNVRLKWGGNYPIRNVANFFDGPHFEEIIP